MPQAQASDDSDHLRCYTLRRFDGRPPEAEPLLQATGEFMERFHLTCHEAR